MTYQKIRLYWEFYKSTFFINLLISIAAPFANFPEFIDYFIELFSISFASAGFLMSIVYKEFVRRDEYYFYYNRGISKWQLIAAGFLVNCVISLSIILIRHA